MDLTGRLIATSRDFKTRKPILQFVINEDINGVEDIADKDLKIRVVRMTKPRSLDANAYFHVLCDKLRQKMGISMAYMKNILITSYGQIEYIEEGQALVYKTNAPLEYVQELESVHMKFIKFGDDGAYWYRVYRGSHTYNVEEMQLLLEGTKQEAEALGIEVKTPDEIARLAALWEQEGRRNG